MKIITHQPKTFEDPNPVDINPVITEYPRTSHKLFKTIRLAENVGPNSSLYSDTKEHEIFFKRENCKRSKMRTCF